MWRLGLLGIAVIGTVGVAVLLDRAPPAVELRPDGVVLLDGRATSLAALSLECRGRSTPVLRVEDTVPWSHVEWVLMAIQAAGLRQVRFEFPDGPLVACFYSDYWEHDVRHIPDGHFAGLVDVFADEFAEPGLPRRLVEGAARARETGLKPLSHVFAGPAQPFSAVAPALRAVRDAHVELEFPFWGFPAREVPDVRPLPPLPELPFANFYVGGWPCACRRGIREIDLPVADMAEEDRGQEQDDRLILQLDRDGRVFGKEEGSLDDLAAYLRERRDRYDLKMRQEGKSGLEEFPDGSTASKLYVLIRADRAAPARQVGFLLHVLAREGFYKVQFAVRKKPGTDPGPCVGRLAAKLQCFLPTDNLPDIVRTDEPSVRVYVDPDGYRVGTAEGLDAAELGRLVREARADPTSPIVVAVHVALGVAHDRVVAAVNEITRAGWERIDFVDLAPPDAATRRVSPLPR